MDQSVGTVFGNIGERAKRLGKVLRRELTIGGNAGPFAALGPGMEKATAAMVKAQAKIRVEELKTEREREKLAAKSVQTQETAAKKEADARIREANRAAKEEQRIAAQEERALRQRVERETAVRQRANEKFAERVSHRTSRFLAPNAPVLSMAGRLGRDIVNGVGIDYSVGGLVGQSVGFQAQAQRLANQGYQPGQPGANGQRVAGADLEKQASGLAAKYSMNRSDVIGAMEAYVTPTGDLQGAREQMEGFMRISIATGTSLQEVANAAGQIGNAVGEVPNKAKVVETTLMNLAAQGKLGAVEMKDMAKYMALLASPAMAFEGDTANNINRLGALAQMSRAYGGATSAAEAARSIARLQSTMETPARIAEMENLLGKGVTSGKGGKLRDPIELIKAAIAKTGGDTQKLQPLFANLIGAKPMKALANVYKDAELKKEGSGMAAIDAMLGKFMKASMGEKDVADSVKGYQGTDAARVQDINNQFQLLGDQLRQDMLPVLQQVAPHLKTVLGWVGEFAGWASSHPMKAIGMAMTFSLSRALVESSLRGAIERALLKDGGELTKFGAAASKSAQALAGLSLAISVIVAAVDAINAHFDGKDKGASRGATYGLSAKLMAQQGEEALNNGGSLNEAQRAEMLRSLSLYDDLTKRNKNLTVFDSFNGKASAVNGEWDMAQQQNGGNLERDMERVRILLERDMGKENAGKALAEALQGITLNAKIDGFGAGRDNE